MNILFTICGRAGSKGCKNKNLKLFKGQPLVNYTLSVIGQYIEKHGGDHVTVALNTDSQELIKQVKEQEFVPNVCIVERKEELAGDMASKVEVIQDTYFQCKNEINYDVVVDLDLTSPMRKLEDVERAIEKLLLDKDCEIVFSVVNSRRSPYFNMVEKNDNGMYYKQICESNYTARQQAPKTYEMNASIYAYSTKFLNQEIKGTLLDYNCDIIVMEDYLVLDIDSEEDFKMMELLWDHFFK